MLTYCCHNLVLVLCLTSKTLKKMDKVKIQPFKVIGISVRTTNENNQAAKDIGDL